MNDFMKEDWNATVATLDGAPFGNCAYVSDRGLSLAVVHSNVYGSDEDMRSSALENARIMAASKDLLGVLEELFAFENICDSGSEPSNEEITAWRVKALTAIQKARGEQ